MELLNDNCPHEFGDDDFCIYCNMVREDIDNDDVKSS